LRRAKRQTMSPGPRACRRRRPSSPAELR
jgi:hypothetical protein